MNVLRRELWHGDPEPLAAPEPLFPFVDSLGNRPVVTLCWGQHTNGIIIRGRSLSPEILSGVGATIVDLDRWSDGHGRFVNDADHYPTGAFIPRRLHGRQNLSEGDVADFGAIHLNEHRLTLEAQGDNINLTKPGLWRFTCDIDHADGVLKSQRICLEWDGGRKLPVGRTGGAHQ